MDKLINEYAIAAMAYGGTVQDLRLLFQARHTRSVYLEALEIVEKARKTCEVARCAFDEPPHRGLRVRGD